MKRKQFEPTYPEHWEQDTYQTGSTNPPKGHSGLVAVLMIMVISLTGLVSISGLLNIRLFSALYDQQEEPAPLALEDSESTNKLQPAQDAFQISDGTPGIGITGEAITPVYQRHFQLPEGLYITDITEGSSADIQGMKEGDVLLYLDSARITDQQSLDTLVSGMDIGDRVEVIIYRHCTDRQLTLELTVEETTE